MNRAWCSVLPAAIFLLVSCSGRNTATAVAGHVDPSQQIQKIPPADPRSYSHLRDMKNWRNPYLVIHKDGAGLLDVGNNEERLLKPEELPAALAGLPASAWPYGRVVAVQEIGLHGSQEDEIALRRSRALVAGTLEEMHVLINWVPSS
jgi:hypothetical protein